jgi:hypothetical protein
MSELSEFYTNTMTIFQPSMSQDASGGQVAAYAPVYESLPCRHEEIMGPLGPPAELGGAPTLINLHRFFLDDPGPVQSGWYVKDDDEPNMYRITDYPSKRRQIDDFDGFLVIVAREITA